MGTNASSSSSSSPPSRRVEATSVPFSKAESFVAEKQRAEAAAAAAATKSVGERPSIHELVKIDSKAAAGVDGFVWGLAWAHRKPWLVSGHSSAHVVCWNTESWEKEQQLTLNGSVVHNTPSALNADGSRLATGGTNTVQIWDTTFEKWSAVKSRTFPEHILSVSFDASATRLLITGFGTKCAALILDATTLETLVKCGDDCARGFTSFQSAWAPDGSQSSLRTTATS